MRSASFVAPIAVVAGLVGACGSRGPLYDDPVVVDAGAADVAATEAAPAPTPEAGPPVDAGKEGGTIIDCGICLVNQCTPAILACVTSPSCVSTFQCIVSTCLGGNGGGLDPICAFQCASGDPKGALAVIDIFTCVTQDCGADCGDVLGAFLGGLGGGFGGGGGGGGGGGSGFGGGGGGRGGGEREAREASPRECFGRAFSAWPELSTPLLEQTQD